MSQTITIDHAAERERINQQIAECQMIMDECRNTATCPSCRRLVDHIAELRAQIETLDHDEDQAPAREQFSTWGGEPLPLDVDIDYLIKKAKRHADTLAPFERECVLQAITHAKAAFAATLSRVMEDSRNATNPK